ncbi:hypothetical protein V1509DRAFT_596728 [Lipomyces kononenkoae]
MSVAPTSANISIDEFRANVQKAVATRGATYHTIKVFIFRFEDDATGADRDAKTFSGCMQDVFGIDDVEDLVIEKTSKSPFLVVNERIVANVSKLAGARSLLIVAYIGHAIVESNELQLISESGSQKMLWSWVHNYLVSPEDSIQSLDMLVVLDCCYTGSAVRAGGNRAVQVLAACDCDAHSTARSRESGVTFIQRFRTAAHVIRNAGNLLVNVESLFGELQRSKAPKTPDAVHRIIGNARPLVLPIKRSSTTLEQPVSSSTATNVLFKLSLAGEPTDVLSEFVALIKTIPPEFKVTLENAYESTSVVFLCRASWATFARLRSTLDCVFIAAVKGASLVPGKIDGQAHDTSQMETETRTFGDSLENRLAC